MPVFREWIAATAGESPVRVIWDADVTREGTHREWILMLVRESDLSGYEFETGIRTPVAEETDGYPFMQYERFVATMLIGLGVTVTRGESGRSVEITPLRWSAVSLK